MPVALLLALQVVGPPAPAPAPARPRTARPCPTASADADADEVVVCARVDQEQFRLRPLADRAEPAVPRAEVPLIGDLKGSADVEQTGVGGFPSNRVMLRLKLPF